MKLGYRRILLVSAATTCSWLCFGAIAESNVYVSVERIPDVPGGNWVVHYGAVVNVCTSVDSSHVSRNGNLTQIDLYLTACGPDCAGDCIGGYFYNSTYDLGALLPGTYQVTIRELERYGEPGYPYRVIDTETLTFSDCLPSLTVASFADLPVCDPGFVVEPGPCGEYEVSCQRAAVAGIGCTGTPIPVTYTYSWVDPCGNELSCERVVFVEQPDCPIPEELTENSANCECDCHADPMCDGAMDILDVVAVTDVSFRGFPATVDPNAACAYESSDVDCSGSTDVLDVVAATNVAFRGASPATEFRDPCL